MTVFPAAGCHSYVKKATLSPKSPAKVPQGQGSAPDLLLAFRPSSMDPALPPAGVPWWPLGPCHSPVFPACGLELTEVPSNTMISSGRVAGHCVAGLGLARMALAAQLSLAWVIQAKGCR